MTIKKSNSKTRSNSRQLYNDVTFYQNLNVSHLLVVDCFSIDLLKRFRK